MKSAINKTYIHYYNIKVDGTKEYLYSVLNKQVRGKFAIHEESEHLTRIRLKIKEGIKKLNE